MVRSLAASRRGSFLLGAVVAGAALLASVAPAAASGAAPLIDGWRPAPVPVVVTVHAYLKPWTAGARDKGKGRTGQVRVAAQAVRIGTDALAPAGGIACSDRAWSPKKLTRIVQWQDTFRWAFQAPSTPKGIGRRATERALKRSVRNITAARNDCGRADRVSATAIYLGRTDKRPAPTSQGGCAARDGVNVVGFGRLPSGIAGLTCVWSIGNRIIEADIKLDRGSRWAVSLSGCSFASMVEAVSTHEFGHAFGLGHVGEATHGRLTMSERLDGYCQLNEATLGLGDLLGLEARY